MLITKYGIPPSHLSAAGYSEFHPVTSNDTADGRAQNRRLDVVILAPSQPMVQLPETENQAVRDSETAPNGAQVRP